MPEVRHRSGPGATQSSPTTTATVGQPGQRTVGGAIVMAVAPVAVFVTASHPAAVAVVVAAAVGMFAAASYASGDTPPRRSHGTIRRRRGGPEPISFPL